MLLVALFLITFPFLTYYVSTNLFYRKANDKARGKRPPTIPFLVPGVFHAFSLAYEGPQKYFATLMKDYGNFAPFLVRAGTQSFVVLRDPQHVQKIVQSSNQLTSRKFNVWVYKNVFGSPKTALRLYAGKGISEKENVMVSFAHEALPQKYLTGTSLASLAEIYVSILSRNLHNKMFQSGTWTQIEDFYSFFQQVITRCTMETLFGSAVFKQYPGLVKDYWKFEDAIEGFMPDMPRFFISTAHEGPRDRLHQGIEKWLKANHSGSEFANIDDEDPVWDEHKGSKFIQERDDTFAKIEGIDWKSRTAEVLSVMQRSNAAVVPSTFWTIVELLRKPHLARYLTTEIAQYLSSDTARYDITGITSMPLFQSIHTEVGRLRSATYMIRDVKVVGCNLDEQWTLPQGISVVAFSQDIAKNTETWAKTRPRTMERPLEEFWAERFLIPGREKPSAQKDQKANRIETGKFSMEGLELLELAFGGGYGPGLGRDYLRAIQAATLAVFFTEFELQLCDPEAVDAAIPPVRELAYGTVKMLDKIAVRIRKRKTA